ncbi:MAG: hypothetical protein H5U40_16075, partial [Polyangiaceae bacterium]|nr:hypothetical protein [Polyangiaceae bacterium]
MPIARELAPAFLADGAFAAITVALPGAIAIAAAFPAGPLPIPIGPAMVTRSGLGFLD